MEKEEREKEKGGRGREKGGKRGRREGKKDREGNYREEYDGVGTPANLEVPGCLFVRRYHAVEGGPKYLTMYEFEHEKVPETLAWDVRRSRDTMHQHIGGSYGHAPGSPGVYRRIFPARAF